MFNKQLLRERESSFNTFETIQPLYLMVACLRKTMAEKLEELALHVAPAIG
jgi:hypothetical protein